MKPMNRKQELQLTATSLFAAFGLSVGLLLGAGTLTGCEEKGPAEKAGEKIDDAADDVGDAVEDAADDIEDAVDDATDDNK